MLFNLRLLLTVTLALVVTAAPTETLPKANVVWSCKKSKTVALTFVRCFLLFQVASKTH